MAKDTIVRKYRDISIIEAELADAQARLKNDPRNDVLQRIIRNRSEEKGHYEYKGEGYKISLILTPVQSKAIVSGGVLAVLNDNGTECLLLPEQDVISMMEEGSVKEVAKGLFIKRSRR